jgi:hypothetical protein
VLIEPSLCGGGSKATVLNGAIRSAMQTSADAGGGEAGRLRINFEHRKHRFVSIVYTEIHLVVHTVLDNNHKLESVRFRAALAALVDS